MAFVDRVVGSDEKLIGVASVHWIYAARGFVWLIAFTFLGFTLDHFVTGFFNSFLDGVGIHVMNFFTLIGFITGLVVGLFYFIMWIATEVALTSKRVIFKSGLIFVDVKEADIEEIKAAEVDNGLLGIFLNYGYLYLDARFIKNVTIPAIGKPYEFVKALNKQRENLKSDTVEPILDNKERDEAADHSSNGPVVFENKQSKRERLKAKIKQSFRQRTKKARFS